MAAVPDDLGAGLGHHPRLHIGEQVGGGARIDKPTPVALQISRRLRNINGEVAHAVQQPEEQRSGVNTQLPHLFRGQPTQAPLAAVRCRQVQHRHIRVSQRQELAGWVGQHVGEPLIVSSLVVAAVQGVAGVDVCHAQLRAPYVRWLRGIRQEPEIIRASVSQEANARYA